MDRGAEQSDLLTENVTIFLKEYIEKINKNNSTAIVGKFKFNLTERSSGHETKFCMLTFSGSETKFDILMQYINLLKDLPDSIDQLPDEEKIKVVDNYLKNLDKKKLDVN